MKVLARDGALDVSNVETWNLLDFNEQTLPGEPGPVALTEEVPWKAICLRVSDEIGGATCQKEEADTHENLTHHFRRPTGLQLQPTSIMLRVYTALQGARRAPSAHVASNNPSFG